MADAQSLPKLIAVKIDDKGSSNHTATDAKPRKKKTLSNLPTFLLNAPSSSASKRRPDQVVLVHASLTYAHVMLLQKMTKIAMLPTAGNDWNKHRMPCLY